MIVHKSWIVNSLLSVAIALTCVVGDKQLRSATQPAIKAVIDNSTHAIVGFLSALIVITSHLDKIYLAVACLIISSLIDADHFITAKSLRLSDATSVQSRPFLHNSTIPVLVFIILLTGYFTSQSDDLIIWLTIIVIAFVTHHLRDANRRGLWFAPFGSTPPLSDHVYIILTVITPYLIKYFSSDRPKYTRLPSPPVFDV